MTYLEEIYWLDTEYLPKLEKQLHSTRLIVAHYSAKLNEIVTKHFTLVPKHG